MTKQRKPTATNKKLSAAKVKEAAEKLGVDVSAFKHNSKIKRTETGEVDFDASYKEFADMEEARRYREEVETNLRLVKLQQLRGELVTRDLVQKSIDEVMIALRNEVLAINRKMAPQLAAITDPKQINRMLESGWIEAVEATRKTWRVPENAA